ncbi:MAG: hypothetical protein ACRERE_03870 [Candidatus Entotheonellia bacterium]
MKRSSPPLPPAGLSLIFFPAAYFFLVIVADHDHTAVYPDGCGGMQPDRTVASTLCINSGAFSSNPYEADLYNFPLSRFPAALAVNPPNTPAHTLMA